MFDTLNDNQKQFLKDLDNHDFAKCVVEHPNVRLTLLEIIQKEATKAVRYNSYVRR